MNDTLTPDTPPTQSGFARFLQKRLPLWLPLLLLGGWLVTLGWNQLAAQRQETQLAELRAADKTAADSARSALLERARGQVSRETDAARLQFGMALAWAVRSEMIRNNLDQIDQFFSVIVKQPGTQYVVLAAADDKVRLSTDRRHQGRTAAEVVGAAALASTEVAFVNGKAGERLLAIPVLGLNNRLGTVVIASQPAQPLAGL